MRLDRDEISKIVGGSPRAIRVFENLISNVPANITGSSSIVLNYTANGTIDTPLPLSVPFTLSAESGDFNRGVSWGVRIISGGFSAAPTIGGTGRGILRINGGLTTPSATLAVTATVNGRGYAPFTVEVSRSTAAPDAPGGGGTASDVTSAFTDITSDVFAPITRELMITLPTGDTDATLTAADLALQVGQVFPEGTTAIAVKWQRETAPSVWSDVGAVATSDPSPAFVNVGSGFEPLFVTTPGLVSCNRTETGMPAASAQKFRLVGRIISGVTRPTIITGTAVVAS